MNKKYTITGSLIEAYIFCPRQAWFLSRQIVGNQYNEFLKIGRLISDESYKRDKKEVLTIGGKIDFIRTKNNELLLVEVKKSSKFIKTSKMQLLFYLYNMKQNSISATGEVRIPREKKVIKVDLNEQSEQDLLSFIDELKRIVEQDKPPRVDYSGKCKNCSYLDFCWS